MTAPRGSGSYSVQLADGVAVEATFSEADPAIQPMRICTPVASTGWVYARKTAGHRVTGTLRLPGRTFDLASIGARGHHDWTAGYMRRQTFWNWGCLAGPLADGRVVGLNVSCGVNETSFTESCFWLDGQLHKLDAVHFDYDRRRHARAVADDLATTAGSISRSDPRPSTPNRSTRWVVATNFHQLIGRYDGHLETAGRRAAAHHESPRLRRAPLREVVSAVRRRQRAHASTSSA